MATELARMKEWDSVVTCHRGHPEARTWNLANGTIGKHSLISRHVDEGALPHVRHVFGSGTHFSILSSEISVCLFVCSTTVLLFEWVWQFCGPGNEQRPSRGVQHAVRILPRGDRSTKR